jgi:PKD repeat protein
VDNFSSNTSDNYNSSIDGWIWDTTNGVLNISSTASQSCIIKNCTFNGGIYKLDYTPKYSTVGNNLRKWLIFGDQRNNIESITTSGNKYGVQFYRVAGTDAIILWKIENGVGSVLAQKEFTWVMNQTYAVTVIWTPNEAVSTTFDSIQVFINDTIQLNSNDTTFFSGYAGLGTNDGISWIDNVDFSNSYEYYAYGDSITRGGAFPDFNPYGFDTYIMQYRDVYYPNIPVWHNRDGGGKNSTWGLNNIAMHYDGDYSNFLIFFGYNDRFIPMTTRKANLKIMYDYVLDNGTSPHLIMPVLSSYYDLKPDINELESYFSSIGVPYIRFYDAIDTIPFNQEMDDYNSIYYELDGVHPNYEGHTAMSNYLYYYFNDLFVVSEFTAYPLSGTSPLNVEFTQIGHNHENIDVSYRWDFNNDGIIDNTDEDPIYQYTSPGIYTINLTVSNFVGNNTNILTDYITVDAFEANFTAFLTTEYEKVEVSFTATSNGNPTWLWDFGDGSTSIEQNPTHIYDTVGIYTVTLTADNGAGNINSVVKTDYITIVESPYVLTDSEEGIVESFNTGIVFLGILITIVAGGLVIGFLAYIGALPDQFVDIIGDISITQFALALVIVFFVLMIGLSMVSNM